MVYATALVNNRKILAYLSLRLDELLDGIQLKIPTRQRERNTLTVLGLPPISFKLAMFFVTLI